MRTQSTGVPVFYRCRGPEFLYLLKVPFFSLMKKGKFVPTVGIRFPLERVFGEVTRLQGTAE